MIMKMKHFLFLAIVVVCFASCVVQVGTPFYYRPLYYGPGIGLGSIVAAIISWDRNKSILLALVCALFGWLYVIYAIIVPKR